MKTAEVKIQSTAARRNIPFFDKESERHFFGKNANVDSFYTKQTAPFIQPKLTIGQPDDKYEEEADAMADKVVQRKCAECEKEEELQKKEGEKQVEEPYVMAQSAVSAPTDTPNLQRQLNDAKGGGSPLSEATRSSMESAFGTDFSGVKIHTDRGAVQMNKDLNALAFTHGSDIYFNEGKYDEKSKQGQHLLAHELTHVVQQGHNNYNRIDKACLPSPPCPAPGSSTPIPGSAEDFIEQEEAKELGPRARRKRMSCSRATSTGHAGRARQLENLLQAHDPALRAKIHGIFIDMDMSGGTGAFVDKCNGPGSWADIALPPGCTVPQFTGASKPCVFVHGNLNQEAFQFNRTSNPTIGGLPREDWKIETLQTLIHEVQHTVFDSSIAGRPVPVGTAGCPRASIRAELTELNAIMSEFPIVIRAVPAAPGPARTNAIQRLDNWFNDAITNPDESLSGTLKAMRCTCNCAEVNAHVRDIFNFVSSSWTAVEKTAFNTELRRPVWNAPPIDLNWPL